MGRPTGSRSVGRVRYARPSHAAHAGEGLTDIRKPSFKFLDQIQRGLVQLGRATLLTTAATTRTQTTVNPQSGSTPATRHHRATTRPTPLTEPIPPIGLAPAVITAPNPLWARTQSTRRRAARTPFSRHTRPGNTAGAARPPGTAGDASVARAEAPGDGSVGAGRGRHAQAREVSLGWDGAGAVGAALDVGRGAGAEVGRRGATGAPAVRRGEA